MSTKVLIKEDSNRLKKLIKFLVTLEKDNNTINKLDSGKELPNQNLNNFRVRQHPNKASK